MTESKKLPFPIPEETASIQSRSDVFLDKISNAPLDERFQIYLNYINTPECQKSLVEASHWEAGTVFAGISYLKPEDRAKGLQSLEMTHGFQELAASKPVRIAIWFDQAIADIKREGHAHTIPEHLLAKRDDLVRHVFGKEAERTVPSDPSVPDGDTALLKSTLRIAKTLQGRGRPVVPNHNQFEQLLTRFEL